MLQNYFRSGWAFLIPYLAAYLLYAWLKWPVNPASGGEGLVKGMSESAGALPLLRLPSSVYRPPCLLHVYWALHALHLVLGALALRAWWKGSILNLQLQTSSPTFHAYSRTRTSAEPWDVSKHQQGTGAPSAHLPPALRSSASSEVGSALIWRFAPWLLLALRAWWLGSTVLRSPFSVLQTVAPWILLGLLFWIPGVYLEWPSDPWEHLRRINEWRVLDTVTAHSSWVKSSYFIPYSLLSWCVGLRQIFWLDFYYTGICLLLCWQYYRLARACDLGERAAMVFVLLQALLFGNNIFSFYRYYGISSSIYAQLGAVALTRIVLETAKHPQLSLRSFFSLPHFINRLTVHRQPHTALPSSALRLTAHRQPPALRSSAPSEVGPDLPPTVSRPPSTVQRSSVYRLLLSVLCILPLIRYNHAQGLGIAGLGVGAVIVWRLIEWRRSALWWLIVTTLVINALFLWLYPRPAMVEIHRAQGFLNAWYGFNILNLTSSAGDRMLQIVSVFGLINLAAAFVLICRNHVTAWLTILPVAVMLLPCIAVPLEQVLAQAAEPDNVITFQRFFFSIPPCLAMVCLWVQLHQGRRGVRPVRINRPHPSAAPLGHLLSIPADDSPPSRNGFYALVIVSMAYVALTTAPSSFPFYNRTWNSLVIVPADLRRESSENQASPSSHAAYLSRHWSPQRNTPVTLKVP